MSNINDPNRPGDVHGSSTITPVAKKGAAAWLPWALAAVGLLLLLLLLSRCVGGDRDETATTTTTETTTATAPVDATAGPDGVTTGATGTATVVDVPGNSTAIDPGLGTYLAGAEAAGRRFTFDRINFATASAQLPADAGPTIATVAQILARYPNTRVRVDGYADARGSAPANAQLGEQRANAVAQALIAEGVPASSVTAASGGESNPVDTNATSSGQAENRRTDLVVTQR